MRTLMSAVLAYLVASYAAAAVAIGNDLPADWGGILRGTGEVWQDALLFNGTALSAPLWVLVVLAVLASLSFDPGSVGVWALRGLVLAGLGSVVGTLGEPITWRALAPATFDIAAASIAVGLTAIALWISYSAWRELRDRRRRGGDAGRGTALT